MGTPDPQTVVISGASAGLGAALALAYAGPGWTLGLIARDEDRLEGIASRCRELGATVETAKIDVTDALALAAWIAAFDSRNPIGLVIANAGVFTGHGPGGAMETAADVAWMVSTNLIGTANLVQPAIDAMRKRKQGQIAIIGSLAALQPLADAPGYSASKAGVMAYGEALQEYLIPDRIAVSLVYPGHIETAQVAGHVGALPHMVSAETAAALIKRGLDARQAFIAFPWQLLALIRAGRMLHWRVRAMAGRDFRFHVQRGTVPDRK